MIKSEGHKHPTFNKDTAMKWNQMTAPEKDVYQRKAEQQNRQTKREAMEKEKKECEARRLAQEIEENAERQKQIKEEKIARLRAELEKKKADLAIL